MRKVKAIPRRYALLFLILFIGGAVAQFQFSSIGARLLVIALFPVSVWAIFRWLIATGRYVECVVPEKTDSDKPPAAPDPP